MNTRSILAALSLAAAMAISVQAANWPEWRGAARSGVSAEKDLPLKWSATENVLWKTPLPEPGNSTPIVWENKVFITQPAENGTKRMIACFDRATGKQLWQTGVDYELPEKSHPTNPQGSSSPSTDGQHVYAFFGSAGVLCVDMNGKEVWKRDLGKHNHFWGYGASPVLHKDLCILNFGPGERSFMVALDKKTGKSVWEVQEPAMRFEAKRIDGFTGQMGQPNGSWSTPIIINANGREELVMSWREHLRAFEPATGKTLWTCDGLNPLVYTSPIYGDGMVVALGGFNGVSIAVKPGGNGDVTETHRLWNSPKLGGYIGSGVIHNGHCYVLEMNGLLQCIDLKTGKSVWRERLKGPGPKADSWASVVLADGKIYTLNQSSETFVVEASPQFKTVAVNTLENEMSNSSLAVSDGDIFVRTHKHLWCISKKAPRRVASAAE
ncbi:MAG TPA: PQQ-binding-like beta-propeller repeat protein [Methylomirabilota bacterium]|nr:PQQ-binding-like beta-propeller repeat protein [Methylomirabilota bacterium]